MRKHSTRHHPRTRLAVVLSFALVAALLFSLIAASGASAEQRSGPIAHAAKGHKKSKKRKKAKARKAAVPLSGIYDACTVGEQRDRPPYDCMQRLTALSQAGFRVVINYWTSGMSADDALEYAREAQSVGMQVIWNVSDFTIPMDRHLDLVRVTSSLPATWGYYIGDEVDPANRGQVAELSSRVRGLTKRPVLYVSRPNPSKLRPFKGLADYIGPDDYPVGPIDPPACQTARWASKTVKKNLAMVLQAYSWSIDFPDMNPQWPSASEMRQMRNQATRCGRPKLLLWFCFHCITDYHPNADAYWRDVAWAANGVSLNPNYSLSAQSA